VVVVTAAVVFVHLLQLLPFFCVIFVVDAAAYPPFLPHSEKSCSRCSRQKKIHAMTAPNSFPPTTYQRCIFHK
jgi:hypothetical protein